MLLIIRDESIKGIKVLKLLLTDDKLAGISGDTHCQRGGASSNID